MLDNFLLIFNNFLITLIINYFNMFGSRENKERITVTALLSIAFQCLSDLSQRVDAVKDENLKLKSENQVQELLNSVSYVQCMEFM